MKFFDNNATTPMLSESKTAWLQVQDGFWANLSAPYQQGVAVRRKLVAKREEFAKILKIDANRLVFTSGATESNNGIIRYFSTTGADVGKSKEMGYLSTDHSSVVNSTQALFGDRANVVVVNHDGVVQLDKLEKMLTKGVVSLFSMSLVNHETGTIQPWKAVLDMCHLNNVRLHCDITQCLGKFSLEGFSEIDFLSGSAHKFGGPKGVGFAVIPSDIDNICFQEGGGQEGGRRSGTEDVSSIYAMVTALDVSESVRKGHVEELEEGRSMFETCLKAKIKGIHIVSEGVDRIWNTSMLVMPKFENVIWMSQLEKKGFIVSFGSACGSLRSEGSSVLEAMGFSLDERTRSIRVSSSLYTSLSDWTLLAEAIVKTFCELEESELKSKSRLTQVIEI